MHNPPEPKAQAKILRTMFAEAGIPLGHRQALDKVSRLHGYPSWNVMSPALVRKTGIARVRHTPNKVLEDAEYQFEAIAYVKSRKDYDLLEQSGVSASALWAENEKVFKEFGLHTLEQIDLSEDDGQSNKDIKVFVCVRVSGRLNVAIRENDTPPLALVKALDSLSAAACCSDNGKWICVPEDNWELVSID